MTKNIVTRIVTSVTALYFAKSGVNTPISSPPLEIVIVATERKDRYSFFIAWFVSGILRNFDSFLIPIIIGMKPIRPITNGGMAKASKAANDEITTSNTIPRNCPMITFLARRLGVENKSIKMKVSSILVATKAPIPIPKRLKNSDTLGNWRNSLHLIVTKISDEITVVTLNPYFLLCQYCIDNDRFCVHA
jgi:hypothetical protein